MENTPLISLIVPIYNAEKYLKKCIDSICAQTYENLQIILVNDGSTDDSKAIIDQYVKMDPRIVAIHKQNAGVSEARNTGLDAATGDYVCFSDADDFLMPDYVDYLYQLVIANDADIALTTKMFGNYAAKQEDKDEPVMVSGVDAVECILCGSMPIGVYCKLFKRKPLMDGIIFEKDLRIGEGFNFNIRCFEKTDRIVVGSRRIYYYRVDNSDSATTKFSEVKWRNGLYAMKVMKHNFIHSDQRIMNAWKFAVWRTYSGIYTLILLSGAKKECKDFYRECKKIVRAKALTAFRVPASRREKLRAAIMFVSPSMVAVWIKLKRKIYGVKVKN